MLTVEIREGVLTIPSEILHQANLEDGALVDVEYQPDNGVIILKPKSNDDDYVVLSEKGKEMIEEALEAERKGEVIGPFSNIKDALKALKES